MTCHKYNVKNAEGKLLDEKPGEYARLRKLALRNQSKRAMNEVLRITCGTSAAAARRDMGM